MGAKVKLGEVQDVLIDASHLTKPEAIIHEDECNTPEYFLAIL